MPASPQRSRRVLIASSHPLFAQGLRSLLRERQATGVEVVGVVANLEQALAALSELNPDLIIVDYDDDRLNREEFLARFVEGEQKLRVVLLSLQSGGEALVYDRRTLGASEIDEWIDEWITPDEATGIGLRSLFRGRGARSKIRNRRDNMKHFVIAGILVIVSTACLLFGLTQVKLLPVAAATQAIPIDNLFYLEFGIIAFLFSLIVVMIAYSLVVFRRKKGDTSDAVHIEGNTRLEVAWTVIPLITVLGLGYLGGSALRDTMRPDPKPLEIDVISQQWSWRFDYPVWGIASDVLMLPINKQAVLRLSSNDVIHSFWVPEFRVKQDALPGGEGFVRELRINPDLLGDYKVRCAELCGLRHTYMEAPVKVVSQTDFDAWVKESTAACEGTPEECGAKFAKIYGCITCHSADGSKLVGPTWKGIFGETVSFVDGSSASVDEAYLHESIVDPNAHVVNGFPPSVMPQTYKDQLSEDQINAIIAYIKSLK